MTADRPRESGVGIPAPGFSTALAYYDSLRAERLPAALTQSQRDFFGAHTYRRVDRDGVSTLSGRKAAPKSSNPDLGPTAAMNRPASSRARGVARSRPYDERGGSEQPSSAAD